MELLTMTTMTGQTLSGWQQQIQQQRGDLLSLLTAHLATLSVDDNAWITLATPEQIAAQLAALAPR